MHKTSGKGLILDTYERRNKNCGFWLGNPTVNAKKIYCDYFGIANNDSEKIATLEDMILTSDVFGRSDLELSKRLKSDLIFLPAEPGSWKSPSGKPMWDISKSDEPWLGILADCEDAREIEHYNWPDASCLNFDETVDIITEADKQGLAVFGGMWCAFFHVLADLFGMENYFVKMHTDPKVVLAVTERIVDFYLEANKRCFEIMGGKLTSAFIGNDFGSQLACMISVPFFKEFIMPYMKKLVDQIKSFRLNATMHSCGAIYDLIPYYIELGIEALHPLQAKAVNMEPERLAKEFGKDLIFIGGVDTQELLPFGAPVEVKDEVRRLKEIFGENYIVSPSHEALLENVPIENVIAMSEAAKE